jgi:S1-C subfamily serine protease
MRSEKISDGAECLIQHPGRKCSRNYKSLIWGLSVVSVLTLIWALYEKSLLEGYVNNLLAKGQQANRKTAQGVVAETGSPYTMWVVQPPGAIGDVQTSYHRIIDMVRPAVISIDAAIPHQPTAANKPGVLELQPHDIVYKKICSGVIIDPRGYVLSSYHVITGAEALKATVYGPGGAAEFPLKLVKADINTDMALLRIQSGGPFSYAVLGNSDASRTGDMVLTISSPFGFEQSVTSGMISSRNRTLQVGNIVYEKLIQTDSPADRGSSGGPMLNVQGEVVGINTAIFSPGAINNSISFAIPINHAAELIGGVIDFNNMEPGTHLGQLATWITQGHQVGNAYRFPDGQMITSPHAQRGNCLDCHPQLLELQVQGNVPAAVTPEQRVTNTGALMGVELTDVDVITARQSNMLHPSGVLVTTVLPESPAAKAGIQRGDILVRIAGRKILNSAGLDKLLTSLNLGSRFDVVYFRNGSRQTTRIKTGVL